jgi:hypothetical protein
MNRICFILAAVAALSLPAPLFAQPRERTSTISERTFLNVTVYNGGTALIHDRRRMLLHAGVNRIAWRDVSAQMDATSALLQSIGSASPVHVLEQNFDYDLLDPSALLQKYVGKTVTVVHEARFTGERDTQERAKILSVNGGGVVLQYADRIETQLRGHIIYPTASSTFRDQPTLVLDLQSGHAGPATLDLSYLTSGMTWRVDYVGLVSSDERFLQLTGLVTLSNESGVAYDDARLQLVAGNVNIVQPQELKAIAGVQSAAYSANGVQQENYFEYHLYTLPRLTTILDKQTKQLALLSASNIPIQKTLELRGLPDYYRSAEPDIGDRLPVHVYVTFVNQGGGLGIPLPAGIVRLYKSDSRGLSQFLGSDGIDHTPRHETVRLHLGDSFDVTARKRQTDFHFLSSACTADSSYEILISNAKTVAQDVLVVEPIPGDWQIVNENLPHLKSSASTASWIVHVPPLQRSLLSYTSRVSWCGS